MATSSKTGLRTAQLPVVERVRFADPAASRAWEQMRQNLEIRFGAGGNKLDHAVTWGDLVDGGFAAIRNAQGNQVSGAVGPDVVPPLLADGIPPAPTGLVVTPGLAIVMLQWGRTLFPYFGYAEVWRATEDNQSKAVQVGQTTGWVYSDMDVSPTVAYFYWVRFVSKGGKIGPFNAVAGTPGVVSYDPRYLVDVLSANDPNALLWKVTAPTVINGVPVDPGVYIRDLYLANGIISRAKIGLLAVDDARIASMSVDKLLAGRLQIDQYIESSQFVSGLSGFRINGSGGAEFNNVIVRGGVYATYGAIGGNIIDSTGVKSASYSPGFAGWRIDSGGNVEFNAGVFRGTLEGVDGTFSGALSAATGSFAGDISAATGTFSGSISGANGNFRGYITVGDYTGYGWPGAGKNGAYLGPGGLLVGNADNGRYFQVTQDGNLYSPGFKVENGTLTIDQANVINTLNIAGEAVTTGVYASLYNGGGFSVNSNVTATMVVFVFPTGNTDVTAYVNGSSGGFWGGGLGARVIPVTVYSGGDQGSQYTEYIPTTGFGVATINAGVNYVSISGGNARVLCLVLRR